MGSYRLEWSAVPLNLTWEAFTFSAPKGSSLPDLGDL